MTSILSCIKDPTPFLLIGGISGIGKTTLIDFLLSTYPDYFEQPLSYTSRPRRDESERYIFVTKEEILELNDRGELINLDFVHGDYYGIKKDTITEIQSKNKIPIKEIHPKNFFKFKKAEFNSISLILENKHLSNKSIPFGSRASRVEEDFDMESFQDYDIKLNISNLTTAMIAEIFIRRVYSFKFHRSLYPHPNEIDILNKSGYNQIAGEFDDNKRVTTKNFHDVTIEYWNRLFEGYKSKQQFKILEIGCGNGWLFDTVKSYTNSLRFGLDISENMYSNKYETILISSARNIPVESCFFDLVVGSLIDPFLNVEVFNEVERILKPKGLFVFTAPSNEWANNLSSRKAANQTTFVTQQKNEISVFSFCNIMDILPTILFNSNLELIDSKSLFIPKEYQFKVSEAIIDSANNAKKNIYTLPIVNAIKLIKTS